VSPPAEPFRDPDRPLAERLDDLLGRLTRQEKRSLLHQHQPAIPRLGLGPFYTGTEALHGLAWRGVATVFPQAIGLGSTWDPQLVRRVGAAVADEVRASGASPNVWAPVVNLLRDPRWGRNEEGYSEDPLLTAALSTAYARGLRGDHPFHLRTAPTLKHFLAYNVEDARDTISVSVRPRVLHEYELPAFRAAIEAGAATGVMPSYNLVNGRPAHLTPLLAEVRHWSRDELLVVSDAWAPSNLVRTQRYCETHAEAHAAALRAGLDSFTDQDRDPTLTLDALGAALDQGLAGEADVDAAVRRVLSIRFRLGELDPPERNPRAAPRGDHRALAREAAAAAMVLLRNDGLLPLRRTEVGRVAVLGPLADALHPDWYSGTMPYEMTPLRGLDERVEAACHEGADRVALRVAATGRYVTAPAAGGPLRGDGAAAGAFDLFDWGGGVRTLRAAANRRYVRADERGVLVNDQVRPNGWVPREPFTLVPADAGTVLLRHLATGRFAAAGGDGLALSDEGTPFALEVLSDGAEAAARVAASADVAVVVVGNTPCINGRETEDRRDLALPPAQERLVAAVLAANPRTVLVVESSYPFAIGAAAQRVPAILWSCHGGQEMGRALADVLLGDRPPAGRLTQTWPRSEADLPPMRDYDIIGSRATYLYSEAEPLFPFGHGLTYGEPRYEALRLSSPSVDAGGHVVVTVDLAGPAIPTEEVVQLYAARRPSGSRLEQPRRRLVGFRRLRLHAGRTRSVSFALPAAALAIWDVVGGRLAVEPGTYDVWAGRSSADLRHGAALEVRGEPLPRRSAAAPIRAADFDECEAVALVDETRERGDAVAPQDGRGWIAFHDVDLGGGPAAVALRVAGAGRAVVDLGAAPAVLEVPDTGGRHAWTTVTAPVSGAAGVRDVRVTLEGGLALAELRFP
jgi:beta-glucosidase